MNKQEAAEFLGVSVRQLERYTSENRIGVRYEKGRTKPTPVYDEGELKRFKDELERPVHRPAVQRMESPSEANTTQSDGTLSLLSQTAQIEVLSRLADAITATRAPEPTGPELGPKLLLTLDECRTLTGLSREVLRTAIEDGSLKGKIIGRSWRIKRSDLDSYIDKL